MLTFRVPEVSGSVFGTGQDNTTREEGMGLWNRSLAEQRCCVDQAHWLRRREEG